MRKIQVVMISALLSGISLYGFAQEPDKKKEEKEQSLNREMTLEREYDPIVQDAAKVITLPEVREMSVSKRPIVYSDYAVPLLPEKEMNVLPASSLMTEIEHNRRNGYLHFAGGMLMNFNGDFGYHLLNTDRDRLGAWFSHRSSNGKVEFDEAYNMEKRKAKFNDNIGGLDYKHRFDKATFKLGGKFGHSAFNYYGFPTNPYLSPSSSSTIYPTTDSTTNQGARTINAYAGIRSEVKSSVGYHVDVDYTNFNQKYSLSKAFDGMTENHIAVGLGLSSPVNNGQCFGMDIKANILTYSEPTPVVDVPLDSAAFDTHFNATFSPYFRMNSDRWKLLLGLNLMLVSQHSETDVLVSPNVKFEASIANWSVFYADLSGGIESNSMAELARTNRYINPAFTADASKTWADLQIGVRSSAAAGLWFDIFAGYKYTESDLFFNPSSYNRMDNGFNNVSVPFQPTAQRIQVGAALKYDYKQIVDFYLKGVYNYYDLKYNDSWKNVVAVSRLDENSDLEAYGKPSFVANFGINIRPVKPLTIGLDYCMMSGMYAYLNSEIYTEKTGEAGGLTGTNVKMDAIHDLRLRTSWQFNDMFSIYAQFNNLLFRQQELYYGYPLQPFSAMAGFNVSF
ncbi:TonB-dependent receptor [Bacteroides sp. OttesenSCG-928-D19]|nr:TonB-dependent receptor [Bacteroides sp. OttesenSCG-928-D19]